MDNNSNLIRVPLNLSDRYQSNWGAWEIFREIVSNAYDAEGEDAMVAVLDDRFVVSTTTIPNLANLTMIGGGTKDASDQTIGQFGEGFKLAALTATRLMYDMHAEHPDGRISFELEPREGTNHLELVMYIDPSKKSSRFSVAVDIPNAKMYEDHFLPRKDAFRTHMLPDTTDDPRLFIKGVYIRDMKDRSLSFSWNLNCDLNRDRDIPDSHSMADNMADYFLENPCERIFYRMMSEGGHIEMNALDSAACDVLSGVGSANDQEKFTKALLDAFHRKHGDKVCFQDPVDFEANAVARAMGWNVVAMGDMYIRTLLNEDGGIQSVTDVVSVSDFFPDVDDPDNPAYNRFIPVLDRICQMMSPSMAPAIRVYQPNSRNDAITYKNSTIWLPGPDVLAIKNREDLEAFIAKFIPIAAKGSSMFSVIVKLSTMLSKGMLSECDDLVTAALSAPTTDS